MAAWRNVCALWQREMLRRIAVSVHHPAIPALSCTSRFESALARFESSLATGVRLLFCTSFREPTKQRFCSPRGTQMQQRKEARCEQGDVASCELNRTAQKPSLLELNH
jgi:hypothetical protein